MQEQLRFSIEQVIREHIAQDVDFDSAVTEASREIVRVIFRPLDGREQIDSVDVIGLLRQINDTLTIPAAEYVPAIGDVFTLLDSFSKAHNLPKLCENS